MRLRLASNGLVQRQEGHAGDALSSARAQLEARLTAKRAKLAAVEGERAVWAGRVEDLAQTGEVPALRKRVDQLQQVVLRVRHDEASRHTKRGSSRTR